MESVTESKFSLVVCWFLPIHPRADHTDIILTNSAVGTEHPTTFHALVGSGG